MTSQTTPTTQSGITVSTAITAGGWSLNHAEGVVVPPPSSGTYKESTMRKRISTLAVLAIIAGGVAGPSAAQASLPTGGSCSYHIIKGGKTAGLWVATCSYKWDGRTNTESSTNIP